MAGWRLWPGDLSMIDWQAELDALFKQNTAFLKSIKPKVEAARLPPGAVVVAPPAAATRASSEREEITKRVASFKAHQQRAIREREEYATSVLVRLKATLAGQSEIR
jgi:hypothetical protein